MMRPTRYLLAAAVTAALAGCNLAPTYQRPTAPVPSQWNDGLHVVDAGNGTAAAALGWREFFRDPRLQRVIAQALANNRDLRVAALTIEKEREEYRIQRSDLFPSIDVSAGQTAVREPASIAGTSAGGTATAGSTNKAGISRVDSVELGFASYELDLFGKVRNQTQAALETYFAQVETQRSTQISLIAEVAEDWLTVAEQRRLLALAQNTYQSEQTTYALVQKEHAMGAVSGLDLAQAQASVQSARNDVATYTTAQAQAINALNLIVGASVSGNDLPDPHIDAVTALTTLPAGIPSSVLQQRPDVLAAEHTLKGANADIGAARANFFPSISLTANDGSESPNLSGLFGAGNHAWTFEPTVNLPIFTGGANLATLKAAKTTRAIDVADYEKTIQTAFEEVANALATRATINDQLDAQNQTVNADQHSYDLAMALYKQGSYSLLDALTEQRLLYTAQQSQVSTQLNAQTSMITLYKALGGGWFEHTQNAAPTDVATR